MLSLLGAALGFGTSIIPSILDLFQQKQKDAQELKMLEAKGKYAEQLSSLKLDELDAKADIAETEGIYASMRAANAKSGQTAEKAAAAVAKVNKPAVQEVISQLPETIKAGMSTLMPSVEPPNEESSVSNINPIVLPNPNDQVLAERLNNTRSA